MSEAVEHPAAPEPIATPPARPAAGRWALAAVLAVYLAGALASQATVRLDFGPDEWQHLQYVHVLATEHRLPTIQDTHIAVHPPLYYLPAAVIWSAFGVRQAPSSLPIGPAALAQMTPESVAARHAVRTFSALLGCLVLLVCWWVLETAGVGLPTRGYLLFALAALPMFQHLGGVANNELASVLQASVLCLVLLRTLRQGACDARCAAWIGFVIGLGMWIKATTAFAVPLALYVVWVTSERAHRPARLLTLVGVALAVGCWWPLRMYHELGSFNPCPIRPGDQPTLRESLTHPLTGPLPWLRTMLMTFLLPDWSWRFIPARFSRGGGELLAVAAIVVWLVGLRQGTPFERRLRGLGLAGCALVVAGVLEYVMVADMRAAIGGRYLLNGLPWLAVLMAGAVPLWRQRLKPMPGLGALLVGLFLLADVAWWLLASDHFSGIHP